MVLGRRETIDELQMTDAEIEAMRNLGVPKGSRSFLRGDASVINARTRAARNMVKLMRLQAEMSRAEVDMITADRELVSAQGESASAEQWRVRAVEAERVRDEAIAGEQTARHLLEIKTAQPALARHAAGTKLS